MLQAHSWLWHYLWVAPNIVLLGLGLAIWKRRLWRQFPAFFAYALLGALSELAVYTTDVVPSISAETFWRAIWTSLLIEGPLKFFLVGEILSHTFGVYASLKRLASILIRVLGVVLVLAAAVAAAYPPNDSRFGIISGAHRLEQTIYLVETGLLLFIFLFSAYFKLRLSREIFGIALGLSISACVHLGSWAFIANGIPSERTRSLLDFLNMAVYQVCVLIWCYYLLARPRSVDVSPPPPNQNFPHSDLGDWNREVERLMHS